jgi:hypothetical protein
MSSSFQLPSVLLQSADYKVLNAEQRRNFEQRLWTCEDLAVAGVNAAATADHELLGAIDDIQLDVLSLMSDFGVPESSVSAYKIQSSWTFECDRQTMAQYVTPQVGDFLRSPLIGVHASNAEARKWLANWANFVRLTLDSFAVSSTFTEAITHLIVIDALLAAFLVFAASFRLAGNA